jgi:hypothetical protein
MGSMYSGVSTTGSSIASAKDWPWDRNDTYDSAVGSLADTSAVDSVSGSPRDSIASSVADSYASNVTSICQKYST